MKHKKGSASLTQQIDEIFHKVADLTQEARLRYYDTHGVNALIRKEVETLLPFDSPLSTTLDRDIHQVVQRALKHFEKPEMRCGPYRLGELLGRGGMGTVYLAERADGEIAQRAAIKLLRPGMDDPQLRQRFLAERQILAALSHPNIARLLDAGHREDGQPYLAMEYVEGRAIDLFAAGFSIRRKVSLFRKVCAAVSYLHRNLVVHRDLKPANILVNPEGEPKLLDFGIAKILDLASESTVSGMRLLTPDFASPEQVAGRPVTTATDIYSLGAVLYKLVTGVSPHRVEGESYRAVPHPELEKKSTPPAQHSPELPRDLEIILTKALRREPQERYATVEQFSEDLENFLTARPVQARKGDTWYQTRKLLRRHWLPVAAAALAIGGLSTGLLVANQQRAIAQRRFMEVRQLANKLFDIDVSARGLPGSTKTRELIVDTSLDYLQRLSEDVGSDPELALEVGNAYMRVARVQGVPISANLGQEQQAAQNLHIAEKFIQLALARRPRNRTAFLRSAQIAHDQMILARSNRQDKDALALARKSAEWLEKFHAGPADKADASAILVTYLNVADQEMLAQQYDDALNLCHRALEIARSFDNKRYLASFLWVSADIFRAQGNLEEALKEVRESIRMLQPSGGGTVEQGLMMNFIYAQIREGKILGEDGAINLGKRQEAVAVLQQPFDTADKLVHQDANDENARGRLASAGITMADILRDSEPARALDLYDHVFRHVAEIKNNASYRRYEVSTLAGSSYSLRRLGRSAEARRRIDEAFERLRQVKDYPAEEIALGLEVDETLGALADWEAARGNVSRAIEVYEELIKKVSASHPEPDVSLSDAVNMSRLYFSIAGVQRRARHADAAATWESLRLDLWRRWDVKLPHNAFISRQLQEARTPRS